MKVFVAVLFAGVVAGFMLTGVAPGEARSRAEWCQMAADCANEAVDERADPNNPGMGKKFKKKKAQCQVYSKKCNGG